MRTKQALTLILALAAACLGYADTSDKPKYTSPSSSKPSSSAPSKPSSSAPSSGSKYSAPSKQNEKKETPPPKYTSPSGSSSSDSKKPPTGGLSDKARASNEAASQRKFQETQKATAPPKPKYTTPEGKEVAVRTATEDAKVIRNMPSTSLQPEVRQKNINVHITQHHYRHDYDWYRSQPVVYVGGGYSSAYWYMMSEWDAERRARWLYHHRYDIDGAAYQQGMRDAQVAAAVARMENQRLYRDANYTDPEFKGNPAVMYTDDYVDALYNPTPVHSSGSAGVGPALVVFLILGSILLLGLICWGAYALFFKARFGS